MRVTLTGATGLIGPRLVAQLRGRGDEVTVLTRNPEKARAALAGVQAVRWADPTSEAAPVDALAGRGAVIHLAGEPVAQRWNDESKRRILESREAGTRSRGPRVVLGRRLLRQARR
jgi:NAD dependent epimerase/dehydratase family enzyme